MKLKMSMLGIAAIMAVMLGITACGPSSGDIFYAPRYDFEAGIPIPGHSADHPTLCYWTGSDHSTTGSYMCRVVIGIKIWAGQANDDYPKYVISYLNASVAGYNSNYGYMLVQTGGRTYEGCTYDEGNLRWLCDFRTEDYELQTPITAPSYIQQFARWEAYSLTTDVDCADGVLNLWEGVPSPGIFSCVEGPYDPSDDIP